MLIPAFGGFGFAIAYTTNIEGATIVLDEMAETVTITNRIVTGKHR